MIAFFDRRVVVGLVLAAALVGGGCQSATEKQRSTAGAALKDFHKSLNTLDSRVDASIRAIERLRSSATFDLQRAYQDFLSESMNVTADANTVGERAEVMRDTGVDYFVVARKEAISDSDPVKAEEIRKREANTKKEYDMLQTSLGEARETYRTYRNQLGAINKYLLARELSRERVIKTYPQLDAARDQAQRVKDAIADVVVKTDAVEAASKTE